MIKALNKSYKYLKNKHIKVKDIFLLFLIVLSLSFGVIKISFAIFSDTLEKSNVVSLIAATPTYNLESKDSDFNNTNKQIIVPLGTEKFFNLEITSTSLMNTKYKIYYSLISPATMPSNVVIGVSDLSSNPNTNVINSGEKKIIRIGIQNNSSENITLEFGVQGGYYNNQVVLGTNKIELTSLDERRSFAGSDVGMNNSTETQLSEFRIYGRSKQESYALVSSGTQYIDTGIYAKSSIDVELDFTLTNTTPPANLRFFGAMNESSQFFQFDIYGTNFEFYKNNLAGNVITVPSDTNRHIVKITGNSLYFDNIYKGDVPSYVIDNIGYTLYLFGRNNYGTANIFGNPLKVNGLKIWDSGTIVRNFTPVPQGNTLYSNTPAPSNCLWDKVTKQYFTNKGTGSFSIENIVSPETPVTVEAASEISDFDIVTVDKQNLMKYSEPTQNSELANRSNISYLSSTGQFANYASDLVYFDTPGVISWAYPFGDTYKTDKTVYVQFYIQMDDFSAPVLGANITSGDFSVVINGGLNQQISILNIPGTSIYRVTTKSKYIITGNCGVAKYSGQSTKKFKVSRFSAIEDLNYDYIKTTGSPITSQSTTKISSTLRSIQVASSATSYTYKDNNDNKYVADYIEVKNGTVNLVRNVGVDLLTGVGVGAFGSVPSLMTGTTQRFYKNAYDTITNTSAASMGNAGANSCMSNKFPVSATDTIEGCRLTGSQLDNLVLNKTRLNILETDTEVQRVAKANTWLQSNNVILYYQFYQPLTTNITSTAEGQSLLGLSTKSKYTRVYDNSDIILWKTGKYKKNVEVNNEYIWNQRGSINYGNKVERLDNLFWNNENWKIELEMVLYNSSTYSQSPFSYNASGITGSEWFRILMVQGTNNLVFRTGTQSVTVSNAFVDGKYHKYKITKVGTTMKAYIDGVEKGTWTYNFTGIDHGYGYSFGSRANGTDGLVTGSKFKNAIWYDSGNNIIWEDFNEYNESQYIKLGQFTKQQL